jgi:hypothetical protein
MDRSRRFASARRQDATDGSANEDGKPQTSPRRTVGVLIQVIRLG